MASINESRQKPAVDCLVIQRLCDQLDHRLAHFALVVTYRPSKIFLCQKDLLAKRHWKKVTGKRRSIRLGVDDKNIERQKPAFITKIKDRINLTCRVLVYRKRWLEINKLRQNLYTLTTVRCFNDRLFVQGILLPFLPGEQ